MDPELPDTRRMGRGMAFLAWTLALLLLAALFQGWLGERAQPNRPVASRVKATGAAEVVLQRHRSGHYLVSGRIDGYPVTFLVDTGASDVTVPAALAERLGLRRGPRVLYQTARGLATGYLTTIDRLEIGDIVLERVQASISPDYDADTVLLGMSVLKRLEFAQQGDRLVLRRPAGRGRN
ncbi:MAG: TIGR02281 family clan AA aspartic protease [Gammaproteobacteria bacterium]|nr:MAG: TIGR02281 family clan AA aspartic protease [Gammaproteobacteria bacterium]